MKKETLAVHYVARASGGTGLAAGVSISTTLSPLLSLTLIWVCGGRRRWRVVGCA